MANDPKAALLANGVSEEQAELIVEAIALARDQPKRAVFETSALRSVRRSYFAGSQGESYKKFQQLITNELKALSPSEVAFGDIPDAIREQFSAFCWTMYKGHQERYLDRHEDEDPAEFLNRPQKRTLNVTRLVIDALSKLYHAPPSREFKEDLDPRMEHVRDRLEAIWAGELFNLSMQEADRRTRLVGTVAIRPMYDPEQPGSIRLWLYMSHQLRVIPDPAAPWRPAVVIERAHPFGKKKSVTIWTDEWFVDMRRSGEVVVEAHGLGRIPHVFCKEELSYMSFFVEGRGRILCVPNAILNNDLSDLEEVKQMQGFSLLELVNPVEDEQRIGPREAVTFRPDDNTKPFGAKFVAPSAPIQQLRADASEQVELILATNGVPAAALGAEINKRSLSGAAIRAGMQPIVSDNKGRESQFKPIEHDLADSMLRIVRRHEPGFLYDPESMRPAFVIFYQPLEFPLDTRDQVVKDDFDIAQAINTPAGVMRREEPDLYPTHEEAVEAWQQNLVELRSSGFTPGDDEQDPALQASYGGLNPNAEGREPEQDEYTAADLLEDMGFDPFNEPIEVAH
jgi:hypothetical protein